MKRCGQACFALWWKLKRACHTEGLSQKCSAASYCQLQLHLFFTFCDVNHQCPAVSELCVKPLWYGEQLKMPLPGSWTYATYLFKNKFKALNALLNSPEYTIKIGKEYFCLHASKSCLDTSIGGLYVSITSQVVVCAPAERAETFSLFPPPLPSSVLNSTDWHIKSSENSCHHVYRQLEDFLWENI